MIALEELFVFHELRNQGLSISEIGRRSQLPSVLVPVTADRLMVPAQSAALTAQRRSIRHGRLKLVC